MANMSYVRFENTLRDLLDCYEHMDDTGLSDEEERSRRALVELCSQIKSAYSVAPTTGDDSDQVHDTSRQDHRKGNRARDGDAGDPASRAAAY